MNMKVCLKKEEGNVRSEVSNSCLTMKLFCEVEVVNRITPTCGMTRNLKTRSVKSTLALGKDVKDCNKFFIIHFSSINKSGLKYEVSKNVERVFTRFVSEGKATIRFINPPKDISIKADPTQLKMFLNALKSAIDGQANMLKELNLSNVSVTPISQIPPTKLVISKRSDFPTKGLPRTLEILIINGVKLFNFRSDILLLRHLKSLNLSNNMIQKIPPELGCMPCLKEIILANNDLSYRQGGDILQNHQPTKIPPSHWQWLEGPQITKNLECLDLSGNLIRELPQNLLKLKAVCHLNLANNLLSCLPPSIGRMKNLKNLDVSDNLLSYLPGSLYTKHLETLNISGNDAFDDIPTNEQHFNWSLKSLSASVVLRYRLPYCNRTIPRTLCSYMDNSDYCICGTATLDSQFFSRLVVTPGKCDVFVCSKRVTDMWYHIFPCSLKCFHVVNNSIKTRRYLLYNNLM